MCGGQLFVPLRLLLCVLQLRCQFLGERLPLGLALRHLSLCGVHLSGNSLGPGLFLVRTDLLLLCCGHRQLQHLSSLLMFDLVVLRLPLRLVQFHRQLLHPCLLRVRTVLLLLRCRQGHLQHLAQLLLRVPHHIWWHALIHLRPPPLNAPSQHP